MTDWIDTAKLAFAEVLYEFPNQARKRLRKLSPEQLEEVANAAHMLQYVAEEVLEEGRDEHR